MLFGGGVGGVKLSGHAGKLQKASTNYSGVCVCHSPGRLAFPQRRVGGGVGFVVAIAHTAQTLCT